jgi:hypothetical protein
MTTDETHIEEESDNETVVDFAHKHAQKIYLNTTAQRFESIFLPLGVYLFAILLSTLINEPTIDDVFFIVKLGYALALIMFNVALIAHGLNLLERKFKKIPAATIFEKLRFIVKVAAICAFIAYMSWTTYDIMKVELITLAMKISVYYSFDMYLRLGFGIFLPLMVIVSIGRHWLSAKGWIPEVMYPIGPFKRMRLKTQWGALEVFLQDNISRFEAINLNMLDDLIHISHLAIIRLEDLKKRSYSSLENSEGSIADDLADVYCEAMDSLKVWQVLRKDLESKRGRLVKFFSNARKRVKVIKIFSQEKRMVHGAKGTHYTIEDNKRFMLKENKRVASNIMRDIAEVANFLSEVHEQINVQVAIEKLPYASFKRISRLKRKISKIDDLDFYLE